MVTSEEVRQICLYDGYPMVLVNMKAIGRNEAKELITESWRIRAPKKVVKEWDAAHG